MAEPGRVIDFRPPAGLTAKEAKKPVVIVGGGPVGLAAALELANHGISSVLVEQRNAIAKESKAICWSKRSLEIFDRLGIGDRAVSKGVTWKVGRTYHRDQELFSFDLLPEDGHKRPAFINLQQYYVEQFLLEKALSRHGINLRFSHRLAGVSVRPDHVTLDLETPAGRYELDAEWLIACDGVRSPVRSMLGLGFEGERFEDRFLIADIEMKAEFPPERRFWFEPVFHDGQSALLHRQPDNIYRIDLQLGPGADPERERRLESVIPRIERVVNTRDFQVEWVSVYTFQCRRMERFLHGRVIFAGDSAHVVSPFGARGGNGGLQDIDSLCWRLAAVITGRAKPGILESFNAERVFGADENILNSTRTTKFMTPAEGWERAMRDQTLRLASVSEFARAWVNSGRLSVPCVYPSEGPDDSSLPQVSRPGSAAPDAPLRGGYLLERLGVNPVILAVGCAAPEAEGCVSIALEDNELARARYLGGADHAVYLIRPDQVIAARWRMSEPPALAREIERLWEEL